MVRRKTVGGAIAVALAAVAFAVLVGRAWLSDPGPEPARSDDGQQDRAPLTGYRTEPGSAAPADDAAHEPHDLDARLVATVLRADPTRSFAAIARADGSGTELLGVGDTLAAHPDAGLVHIGEGFVVIDHAGTRVRLGATSRLDPRAEAFLEAVRAAPPHTPSPEELARRHALADRLRARMDAAPGSGRRVRGTGLFEDGDVRTHYEEERLVSVELDALDPDGFYERVGFRDGDRVSSINGIALGDADAGARILHELATADEIVANVEHADGADGEVAVPTQELLDELHSLLPDLLPGVFDELSELPIPIDGLTPESETP